MPIEVGDKLHHPSASTILGEGERVSSTYPALIDEVCIGHRVLIEDGLLRFVCTEKTDQELICNCTAAGILKNSKGINLPDTTVTVPSITERDWECIDWAIEQRLDYLAMSFVRKADDIRELRSYLQDKISDIHLIAKIEKAEAVTHIDEIIDASDGLMVARGDLGVEMDVAMVPIIQKDLLRRCQAAGKPVIVATQMLQSMVDQSTPTRAEVSDVANAIFDGTDAVMLSGETSVGKFPVVTVHTMAHIAEVTETYLTSADESMVPLPLVKTTLPAGALARGALRIVHDLKAKLVVVWTQTGTTARVFSKHHFPVPIIALSPDHRSLRRMALHYGVIPQEMQATPDLTALIREIDRFVTAKKYAEPKDRILIVAGWSPGTPGTMNGLVIHVVGDSWITGAVGTNAAADGENGEGMNRPAGTEPPGFPKLALAACALLLIVLGPGCSHSPPGRSKRRRLRIDPILATQDYWLNKPAVVHVEGADFYQLWSTCRGVAARSVFSDRSRGLPRGIIDDASR